MSKGERETKGWSALGRRQIAWTPTFDSVGASVHQLAAFGLTNGVTGALKKIYRAGQMLGVAEAPGVLILTRSKT